LKKPIVQVAPTNINEADPGNVSSEGNGGINLFEVIEGWGGVIAQP